MCSSKYSFKWLKPFLVLFLVWQTKVSLIILVCVMIYSLKLEIFTIFKNKSTQISLLLCLKHILYRNAIYKGKIVTLQVKFFLYLHCYQKNWYTYKMHLKVGFLVTLAHTRINLKHEYLYMFWRLIGWVDYVLFHKARPITHMVY